MIDNLTSARIGKVVNLRRIPTFHGLHHCANDMNSFAESKERCQTTALSSINPLPRLHTNHFTAASLALEQFVESRRLLLVLRRSLFFTVILI